MNTEQRIAKLPRQGAYPVSKFVQWIDGKADFRVMDGQFRARAIKFHLCWVCGGKLGGLSTYVVGPMCAVNRVSTEPPSHQGCGEFSATHCPFMRQPDRTRREGRLPEGWSNPGGIMIERNPGVMLLWHTKRAPQPFRDEQGGWLLHLPDPVGVDWWTQGRPATRNEVLAAIDSGLPILQEAAEQDGPRALEALERAHASALALVPA